MAVQAMVIVPTQLYPFAVIARAHLLLGVITRREYEMMMSLRRRQRKAGLI